ncbi:hypothetical protein [Brevundimonas sp.]|uniref:hypothetical protein n=1 Tax=Brevundimonas sp. TaxID=1871086 RepID=UPI0028AB5D3A|nr:hypothetical protein [Brevundimonas sp.]
MALSPVRLPLSVEVLCTADAVYGMVADIQTLAANGRQPDALSALAYLADAIGGHRPILRGVITAEREAAQARHLTQRTLAPFFGGKPAEHPHAANDQSLSPEQPAPDVA